MTVNFDTGAAITAIPVSLKDGLKLPGDKANTRSYKTASGELLSDEGGTLLKGYDDAGEGRSISGRLVNVHRVLMSGSAAGKKNVVLLDGDHGYLIPRAGPIAKGMQAAFDALCRKHPEDVRNLTGMYDYNGIYCFDLWCKQEISGGRDLGPLGPGFSRQARLEARAPKLLRSPNSPTEQEIEEHEAMGHSIHRSWCGHCIRARGLTEQHVSQPEEELKEKALPTISIDYYFFGATTREQESELPGLQVKDSHTGMLWASTVPAKGPDPFAVNFVQGCIEETGYTRIILKSDNEVAIRALKQKVKESAKVEIVPEESKTGDKQASGSVESAVKETKRQCRAMRSALQERLGKEVSEKHHIFTWLGRHGNFLISRYRIGPDGRTPYERLKGKKWRRPMISFGERIWFRPLQSYTKGRSDLAPKLDSGLYVGTHGRNGDVLVMTGEGVIKGGSVKRQPLAQRWSLDGFDRLKGTPWQLRPKAVEDVDGVVPINLPEVKGRLTPEPASREGGPRNLYVRRRDVEEQWTVGCPGCIALQTGLPVRAHSAECRTLVAQRLMASEEGRMRVDAAAKRKAPDSILEDVPDKDEEMHGPSATGQPDEETGPLVLSPQGEVRKAETQEGPESPKRAKEGERRGAKRQGDDQETLYTEAASGSADPVTYVPASVTTAATKEAVQTAISNLEIAMCVNEHAYPSASFTECMSISIELSKLGVSKSHIAEIYNPERFVSRANEFGLRPGFAIDMELPKNSQGDYWDLSKKEDQLELDRLLEKEKPFLLIGAPPCCAFSPLQNLSKDKRPPEETEKIREEGLRHLRVAFKSYWKQHQAGRLFLDEHPKSASSWKEPEVLSMINEEGIYLVEGPMCRWGMTSTDVQGKGFVRKETMYLTNSPELARVLSGECNGKHRHVHLVNGRARQAQVYPPRMVTAILRAVRKELEFHEEFNELTSNVQESDLRLME